jgi:hypothetical protein
VPWGNNGTGRAASRLRRIFGDYRIADWNRQTEGEIRTPCVSDLIGPEEYIEANGCDHANEQNIPIGRVMLRPSLS